MAISYDGTELLSSFAKQRGIAFPLLSDRDSAVIDAYGVRNQEATEGRTAGIPYPGFFLIDPDGVIRAKLFYQGYVVRHGPEELLEAVRALR